MQTSTSSTPDTDLLSYQRVARSEIAERLDIPRSRVARLLRQNIIPSVREDDQTRVRRDEYEDWEFACGDSASRRDYFERRSRERGM